MEQNQFRFFTNWLDDGHHGATIQRAATVDDALLAWSAGGEWHGKTSPVAWAAWPDTHVSARLSDDRASAIAAGRLIECIDGKYIARIPGEVGFDFKREDEPAPSLGKLLRDALARGPVVVASDPNAAMKARDLRAPAKPWAKPEATPAPANKPQGPHAAFFAWRADVPAGHLLGQGK